MAAKEGLGQLMSAKRSENPNISEFAYSFNAKRLKYIRQIAINYKQGDTKKRKVSNFSYYFSQSFVLV